jgi:hypothetical protein
LRTAARDEVAGSSLIRRAASGDREAATALHRGFWPFVHDFEDAIDQHALPRWPFRQKFGADVATRTFLGLAEAVRDMKREEGGHAAHWRKDAECLGMSDLEGPVVDGVRDLVVDAYTPDHVRFFSVIAGTEFIAEELGAFLVKSQPFTDLFSRRRWIWGEVHLIPHDDGPSHLEIDLDLARAYAPEEHDYRKIAGSCASDDPPIWLRGAWRGGRAALWRHVKPPSTRKASVQHPAIGSNVFQHQSGASPRTAK